MKAAQFMTDCARLPIIRAASSGICDSIFDQFFSDRNLFSMIPHPVWGPPTDVYETPDAYVIRAEIPGMDVADTQVELNQNILTIRGHRLDPSHDVKLGFQQMEIHFGYFERVVTLPDSIDSGSARAIYKNGFLCITIPKADEQEHIRRRIPVQP